MPKIPPPTPWKAFGQTAGNVEYLVLLTHLPVRRMTALPKFLNYVRVIRKQLNAGPSGLAGYSLLAQPFSSNYWTLSAWESPAALAGFIRESPHRGRHGGTAQEPEQLPLLAVESRREQLAA